MRRSLLRSLSLYTPRFLSQPKPSILHPLPPPAAAAAALRSPFKLRFFLSLSENGDDGKEETAGLVPTVEGNVSDGGGGHEGSVAAVDFGDEGVSMTRKPRSGLFSVWVELKKRVEAYFKGDEEEEEKLGSVLETIFQRRMSGKHEDTDDDILDQTRFEMQDNVSDEEFEHSFEEGHETDEEIENLYDTRPIVFKKMNEDPAFHMDDKKWDEIVTDSIEKGYAKDTREMEDLLEDMLQWDNLLPDHIKKKVKAKVDELEEMCEKQLLEPEQAYKVYKEFEDKIVMDHMKELEAEAPQQLNEVATSDKKVTLDDPPGEGPILRWQTRVVFGPGGDAWHPKNRKVKLSVTVKELGLSKHQFRRMREIVGKRYHPGRDELTITSERFEHREENRKDCLRTLLNIIEDAGKANKMAEAARVSYVKDRLKANPQFMARLHAKTHGLSVHA
ncbi:hypothetical protein AKJ16_DCAP23956 [Drosera capensis]